MKRNNDYHYSEIDSFEDMRLERSRLILKSKIIETKIKIDIIQTRELFSLPALVLSIARKYIPKDIYGIAEAIFNKELTNNDSYEKIIFISDSPGIFNCHSCIQPE